MDNNAIVQNTSTDIQVNPLRECNPDISVIVPVYNAEQFIADTLDNVSSQSLKNIEIVCVDDGSGDSSAEIIQRKSAEDCRIRYIHQNNGGAGSARNTGIRASTGKYIAFMDADDSYPDNSVLELMFNTAEANSALICGGSCSDENNNLCSGKRSFVTEGFISFDSYQFDYLYVRFIFNRNFLVSENLFFPPVPGIRRPGISDKSNDPRRTVLCTDSADIQILRLPPVVQSQPDKAQGFYQRHHGHSSSDIGKRSHGVA